MARSSAATGSTTTPRWRSLKRSIGVERRGRGPHFAVANNDCVDEARRSRRQRRPDRHLDPVRNHYEYTPNYNDFGHTDDNDHFWAQMDFLTPELLRILQPGRLACIHVKDRDPVRQCDRGRRADGLPFHAEAIFHYRRTASTTWG
jgi:hypothetical protein